MKKIIYFIAALAIVSCKNEPKDYVTFSGKIDNQNSDSLVVRTRGYSKTIKVNPDGTFSDTLKVKAGVFNVFDGKEATSVFLKNGEDINMTLDTKMFDETVKFTGNGAKNSNFLAEKALLQEKLLDQKFDKMGEEELNSTFSKFEEGMYDLISKTKNLDSTLISTSKAEVTGISSSYKNYFLGIINLRKALPKGSPSPTFDKYENHKGGTTSLSDLKGKYVYVDVWATWCGPCKREIPFLKEVEKKYHDKNIEFVSISVDNVDGKRGSHEKWVEMVKDKELGGVQLFAPKDFKSKFVQDYKIKGIPRFILIDPAGNIVDASAPRPSSPSLVELFDSLNI